MRTTIIYWETADKAVLPLSSMTESHIINCINKIEKSIRYGRPWRVKALPYLKQELRNRHRDEEYCEMINSQYDSDE